MGWMTIQNNRYKLRLYQSGNKIKCSSIDWNGEVSVSFDFYHFALFTIVINKFRFDSIRVFFQRLFLSFFWSN